jgi:hypothetical protein
MAATFKELVLLDTSADAACDDAQAMRTASEVKPLNKVFLIRMEGKAADVTYDMFSKSIFPRVAICEKEKMPLSRSNCNLWQRFEALHSSSAWSNRQGN